MISSHVKITCYLHMWKDHGCYGYMIHRAFAAKKMLKWNGFNWHFIGVYIINRTLHDRLEIRNFSSRVEKYFTRSLHSLVKYFSTLEEKFRISARPCNILYLLYKYQWNTRWAFARKHDIFTCEKITVAMATWYIAPFAAKKMLKWNGLAFHWSLYNK